MSPDATSAVARLRSILKVHGVEPHELLADDEETAERAEVRLAVLDPVVSDFVNEVARSELQARAESLDVQAQILDLWGHVLDLLDAVRILSADLGREAEALVSEWISGPLPPKRQALGRLFWGAQLVASEVLTLLRHGYAAGALARWRAVYEMGIRAAVIDLGGDELAARFLDHERVRYLREDRRWWTEVDRAAMDEDDQQATQLLDEWQKEVIDRHGDEIFMREYGWAHTHLHAHDSSYRKAFDKERRPNGPSLFDLSRSIDDYPEKAMRENYYSRASAAVHGSPRSLGDFDEVVELNIWGGPTLHYLGLAIDQTAEDLAQLTYTYIGPLEETNPSDVIMVVLCLDHLVRVCQTSALNVHKGLSNE